MNGLTALSPRRLMLLRLVIHTLGVVDGHKDLPDLIRLSALGLLRIERDPALQLTGFDYTFSSTKYGKQVIEEFQKVFDK